MYWNSYSKSTDYFKPIIRFAVPLQHSVVKIVQTDLDFMVGLIIRMPGYIIDYFIAHIDQAISIIDYYASWDPTFCAIFILNLPNTSKVNGFLSFSEKNLPNFLN